MKNLLLILVIALVLAVPATALAGPSVQEVFHGNSIHIDKIEVDGNVTCYYATLTDAGPATSQPSLSCITRTVRK